jgi:hypothetical protein
MSKKPKPQLMTDEALHFLRLALQLAMQNNTKVLRVERYL